MVLWTTLQTERGEGDGRGYPLLELSWVPINPCLSPLPHRRVMWQRDDGGAPWPQALGVEVPVGLEQDAPTPRGGKWQIPPSPRGGGGGGGRGVNIRRLVAGQIGLVGNTVYIYSIHILYIYYIYIYIV